MHWQSSNMSPIIIKQNKCLYSSSSCADGQCSIFIAKITFSNVDRCFFLHVYFSFDIIYLWSLCSVRNWQQTIPFVETFHRVVLAEFCRNYDSVMSGKNNNIILMGLPWRRHYNSESLWREQCFFLNLVWHKACEIHRFLPPVYSGVWEHQSCGLQQPRNGWERVQK